MKVSLSVTDFAWPGDPATELSRVARAADDGDIDTVWVADHLLQADPNGVPESAVLEAHTTLGFLAAQTSRVRLGTMVAAATYRPAAVLIKAVTTLDVLSGGRAWLGIGSGYHLDEARAMGLPLPPAAERFERLEETIRLAMQMWSGDDTPFHGAHLHLERPIGNPLPVTQPHPPILIGGTGERKTLRLVAKYGDACNVFDIPDGGQTVRHKLAVLAEHCQAERRDMSAIEKTITTRLGADETVDQFVERCGAFAELGISHVVTINAGPWTDDRVAVLADAARELSSN